MTILGFRVLLRERMSDGIIDALPLFSVEEKRQRCVGSDTAHGKRRKEVLFEECGNIRADREAEMHPV